jgi:hypothetical protein
MYRSRVRQNGRLQRLERCAVKVARTVLRGLGGSNAPWLPDQPARRQFSRLLHFGQVRPHCKTRGRVSSMPSSNLPCGMGRAPICGLRQCWSAVEEDKAPADSPGPVAPDQVGKESVPPVRRHQMASWAGKPGPRRGTSWMLHDRSVIRASQSHLSLSKGTLAFCAGTARNCPSTS